MAAVLEDQQRYFKGKGKHDPREPTETTPLLEAGSSHEVGADEDSGLENHNEARRQLWRRLTLVFLGTFLLCLIIFLVLVLLAYSYATRLSYISPDDALSHGLRFQGPDKVDFINVTDGGLWIRVDGRIGVDAGSMIRVNTNDDRGTLSDLFKSIGRLAISILGTVSVSVATVHVHSNQALLANVSAQPIELPLSSNTPLDASWLTPISVPLFIHPTSNVSNFIQLIEDSWRSGDISLRGTATQVTIWGGGPDRKGWKSMISVSFPNVEIRSSLHIPSLPGLPEPGKNNSLPSLSDLVSVESFDVSSREKEVRLNARASVRNLAPPNLNITVPALSFVVSFPTEKQDTYIPVASAETKAFSLTHPNVTLFITGRVLPLPSAAIDALASFASRYLSRQPNPISITSPLFPSLIIHADFPPPATKPNVLRNVKISDMRVKPYGTELLASAHVSGMIVLPKGMNFKMNIHRIFPEIFVYDGDLEESSSSRALLGNTLSHLLQSSSPPAFGHILPIDWLDAKSVYNGTDDEGSIFLVSASIVDVPIKVIQGRETEFSEFLSKIIFGSHGTTAGIRGTVDVEINILGLPFRNGDGEDVGFKLRGLPLQGKVHMGKH